MRGANYVMHRMQTEDPQAWQEYLAESHAFDAATAGDGLTPAAVDWPEYNGAGGSVPGAVSGR